MKSRNDAATQSDSQSRARLRGWIAAVLGAAALLSVIAFALTGTPNVFVYLAGVVIAGIVVAWLADAFRR